MPHPMGVDWPTFQAHCDAWEPTELNVVDLRNAMAYLYHQGTRPLQRSDSFGAAFTMLSILEGMYLHVLNAARVAAAEGAAAEGASGGAADGGDHDSGGSAG